MTQLVRRWNMNKWHYPATKQAYGGDPLITMCGRTIWPNIEKLTMQSENPAGMKSLCKSCAKIANEEVSRETE